MDAIRVSLVAMLLGAGLAHSTARSAHQPPPPSRAPFVIAAPPDSQSLSSNTPPAAPPDSAMIYDFTGHPQTLPLSCESRSAVDWAGYFGYAIGEREFLNDLPASFDPDLGFVGDVRGDWGQVPPYAYGVHA